MTYNVCKMSRENLLLNLLELFTDQYGSAIYYTGRHLYPSGKYLVKHVMERFLIVDDSPRMFCPIYNNCLNMTIDSSKHRDWIWIIGLWLV